MELPEKYSDEFSIDYEKDCVSVGMVLYSAIDGTIHRITDSSSMSVELLDTWQKEYWKISKKEANELLYIDFFPLKLKGHYPE